MEDICLLVQLVNNHRLSTSGTCGFVLGTRDASSKFWSLISRRSKSSERMKL